jgi:DNA-3-methyladenine glycosylase II
VHKNADSANSAWTPIDCTEQQFKTALHKLETLFTSAELTQPSHQPRRGNNLPNQKLKLKPIPPFSFDLTAQIFSNGDKQIRTYEDGKFTQLIRVDGKLIHITLTSKGNLEKPELQAELKTNNPLTTAEIKKAQKIINFLFSLDFNPTDFYKTTQKDPIIAKITKQLCGMRSPTTQTVYEALVDSIVEQQISLKVANTLERKIIKKFGDTLHIEDTDYYEYPTPQQIAQNPAEELRKCGLSQRKTEYIHGISTQITQNKLDLEKFKNYQNPDDIIKEMDALRGIGVWTAELTMLRSMQKWDALPADDLGLRRTIAHYYRNGKKITSKEARKIAKPWGKWKGLAAYYLVIAETLKITV